MSEEEVIIPDELKEMAAVCNPRHVAVVQAILSGKYGSKMYAYMSVYPNSDRDSASASVIRMLGIDKVEALYNALKEHKFTENALSRAEAISLLSDMAKTSLGDLVEYGTHKMTDTEGNVVEQSTWRFKNSALVDESAMRSVSELTATRDGLKIKQHDQKAAIKQLADMHGWNAATKVDLNVTESAYIKRLQAAVSGGDISAE